MALPAGAVKETDESPKSSEDNESSGQVGMVGVCPSIKGIWVWNQK